MARRMLNTLPLLFLLISGCAIVSQRSFLTHLQRDLSDTRLTCASNLHSDNLLELLSLTGSIDIPLLLHYERTRPPYQIHWRVIDESESYDRVEIASVTVEYQDGELQSFNPRIKPRRLKFKSDRFSRDVNVILHGCKVTRHAPVTVSITGIAIQKDGQETPFCSTESFVPESQDFVMDWYSWCGGI